MKFKPIVDALCNYFSLNIDEISIPTPDNYDDEFLVDGKPMEVVTSKIAFSNIEDTYGIEYAIKYSDNNNIDYYKRLDNTDYFFRRL